MTGFVAIVRREIAERRQVLYAAASMALIPLLLPTVRGITGRDAAEVRGWTALIISAAFAIGLAVALGATSLVPRISTRRIGFDFSRPISGGAIWLGHLAAALVLAFAAAAIIWTPSWIAGARPVWRDLLTAPLLWTVAPLLILAILPVLFAASHALALMFRSKSLLLVVDALLALAAWLGAWNVLRRLPAYFAFAPRVAALIGLAAALEAALLVAGYASVSRGRSDVAAAHRALSEALWVILAAAIVSASLYAAWVGAASPRDVASSAVGIWVRPASEGPWVHLAGRARGADARFFYDTRNGRFTRAQTSDFRGWALSRDGRVAAWIEEGDHRESFPVRTWRLDDPSARPVTTRLILPYPWLMELSADGSRLATWTGGTLSIHDLAGQRTVVSARAPASGEPRGAFRGNDVFRLFRVGDASIDVADLDVGSRSLVERAHIETSPCYFVMDTRGERLLALEGTERRIRLFDATTGAVLATLADSPADNRWPVFLADGRIVVTERTLRDRRLLVFDRDGRQQRVVSLPQATQVTIGGEIAPGRLCLGIGDAAYRHAVWIVGLDDGTLRKVSDGLRPILLPPQLPEVSSEATKLFYGADQRSLVRLDPVTGERMVVLGAN